MTYKIETSFTHYYLSEENITRVSYKGTQTSQGLFVRDHLDDIIKALSAALYLREGKCRESVAAFMHTEKELGNARPLESVLPSLEHWIDAFTGGEYERFTKADEPLDYKYFNELQDICFEIKQLKDGRYYEHPLYGHRGIARISTTGGKLVDKIMDLVWRMDDGAAGMQEELYDAMMRVNFFEDGPVAADDGPIIGQRNVPGAAQDRKKV